MIDDEERREVAARLRESREFISSLPKTTPEQNVFDTFELILACIGYEAGNLFDYLAKLIEPEPERTCKMIPFAEEDGSIFIVNCSECGDAIFARGGKHDCNYCPSCGAKVVE